MTGHTTDLVTVPEPLNDWFRKVGTGLSSEDYEEGVRLLAEAKEERDYDRAYISTLRARLDGNPADFWAEWHREHCAAAQAADDCQQKNRRLRRRLRVASEVESLIVSEAATLARTVYDDEPDQRHRDRLDMAMRLKIYADELRNLRDGGGDDA